MIVAAAGYLCCFSAIFLLLAGQALGQIYTESVTTGGGASHSSRSYYMPKMIKIVQDDGNATVMRFDGDYWLSIDAKKKEYWQLTFAELEAKMKSMATKMDAAMQQMRQKLESLPPEQRKKMEEMMGSHPGAAPSGGQLAVKKTGETRAIAGLPCSRYAVTEDGKEILVLWATREVPEFAAMRRDYERFAKSMAAMRDRGGSRGRAWGEAMKAVEGFPMETESGQIKTTVTKLERKATPASEFDPPAGYKKVPAPF